MKCHCGRYDLPEYRRRVYEDPMGRLVHSQHACFQALNDFPYYAAIGPSGSEGPP